MIFQSFNKGGTERVNFNQYEYVGGADIIFDFGNPTCTSEFTSNRRVFNVGNLNVTGSLISYNNPGPIYPTLETTAGGTMVTDYGEIIGSGSYLEWSGTTTEDVTIIVCSALQGTQTLTGAKATPNVIGKNNIEIQVLDNSAIVNITPDNGIQSNLFTDNSYNTSISNGRNGFNMISVTSNGSSFHQMYENGVLIFDDMISVFDKPTSATQTFQLGLQSNLEIQCYLQYPRILTAKEIRQTYKVFSQRFFT